MDSSSLSWKQLISQRSWFQMTSALSSIKMRLMLRALSDQFEVPDLLSVTDISTRSFLEVLNRSSFLYVTKLCCLALWSVHRRNHTTVHSYWLYPNACQENSDKAVTVELYLDFKYRLFLSFYVF